MQRYLALSRTHSYSLLFALPLLVLYELGAATMEVGPDPAVRNGADVLLRMMLAAGGLHGTAAFTSVLLVGSLVLIILERRRRPVPLRIGVLFGMLLESSVYALLFGLVISTATYWVLNPPLLLMGPALGIREQVVLSLGAGIYEELVFRVLLAGGLFVVLRAAGAGWRLAGISATLISAVIFSAFHYIGVYGDPWALESFTFRFLAGLAFSALFLLRGFGVAAWTHALYDVFLTLAQAG
jgi:membrane protease YdiL (CAAX protease family)